jgi:acyl-CoA synthetase (AMP-forming)/AMP-acid ligase II
VPEARSLASLVGAELGADSVPATITLIDDVPLTSGGKPDKNALLQYVLAR